MQVAFYKGRNRLFNRLVSWYLRGPYSHTELILAIDLQGVATCASASFLDGGVRVKTMRLDPDHWDILPVSGERVKAWSWLADHERQGYDVLGLLGFFWRRQIGSQSRWFCSEAIAAMLGWPDPWRLDPMALWVATASQKLNASADK